MFSKDERVSVTGVCIGADDDGVFVFRNGQIIEYDGTLNLIKRRAKFPLGILDSSHSLLRLITRPLRRGIVSGVAGRRDLIVWSRRDIFIVARHSLKAVKRIRLGPMAPPLQVACLDEDGVDAFYFGEYFSNAKRRAVEVFRIKDRCVESIAKIGAGEIEHIHNVIPEDRENLIVLAGDFGDAASIWRVNKLNGEVRCLRRGEQRYRTSAAVCIRNKLLYATDTTSDVNAFMSLNLLTMQAQSIKRLPASAIYGGSHASTLFFSTNLEAALETKDSWSKWITRRLPSCFTTQKIHVYKANEDGVTELANFNPTWLPYRLFQYPTFRIHVNTSCILLSGTAVKKYDNKVVRMPRDNVSTADS